MTGGIDASRASPKSIAARKQSCEVRGGADARSSCPVIRCDRRPARLTPATRAAALACRLPDGAGLRQLARLCKLERAAEQFRQGSRRLHRAGYRHPAIRPRDSGFLAFTAIILFWFMREQILAYLSLLTLGFGVAITGFYPSLGGLLITTTIMSLGFHYYETGSNPCSCNCCPRRRPQGFSARSQAPRPPHSCLPSARSR